MNYIGRKRHVMYFYIVFGRTSTEEAHRDIDLRLFKVWAQTTPVVDIWMGGVLLVLSLF